MHVCENAHGRSEKAGGGQVFSGMIILITGGPTSGEGLNHFLGWKMLQKTAC